MDYAAPPAPAMAEHAPWWKRIARSLTAPDGGIEFAVYIIDGGISFAVDVINEGISFAVDITDGGISYAFDITNGEDDDVGSYDDAYSNGGSVAVPASSGEAIASSLPKKTCQQARGEKAEECAVCLEAYEAGQTLRTMPCSHEFHEACISDWICVSRTCPICRFELPAKNEDDSDVDEEDEAEQEDDDDPWTC